MRHTHHCERCQQLYHCLQRQEKEITGPVCVTRLSADPDARLCWDCFERAMKLRRLDEMVQRAETA